MDCPFRLYLQYLQKCQPAVWNPEVFFVGSKVHDSVENYFRNKYKPHPSFQYAHYYLYEELKKVWKYNQKPEDLLHAFNSITGIAQHEVWRASVSEKKPKIELKNENIARVYIKVDLFDEDMAYLADWKTSKSLRISKKEIIQACTYKIGIDKLYNIDLPEAHFIFPYTQPQYTDFTVDFKQPDVQKIYAEVEETITKIQNAFSTKNFPKAPRTPGMCGYCDLKAYCRGLRV